MNKISTITARLHSSFRGDLIRVNGKLYKVIAVVGDVLVIAPAGWFSKAAAWLGSIVRLDGFWDRVWNR